MRVWDSVRHAQAQGLARRISSARQSRVPATVRASKQGGGLGGCSPPSTASGLPRETGFKMLQFKAQFHLKSSLRKL